MKTRLFILVAVFALAIIGGVYLIFQPKADVASPIHLEATFNRDERKEFSQCGFIDVDITYNTQSKLYYGWHPQGPANKNKIYILVRPQSVDRQELEKDALANKNTAPKWSGTYVDFSSDVELIDPNGVEVFPILLEDFVGGCKAIKSEPYILTVYYTQKDGSRLIAEKEVELNWEWQKFNINNDRIDEFNNILHYNSEGQIFYDSNKIGWPYQYQNKEYEFVLCDSRLTFNGVGPKNQTLSISVGSISQSIITKDITWTVKLPKLDCNQVSGPQEVKFSLNGKPISAGPEISLFIGDDQVALTVVKQIANLGIKEAQRRLDQLDKQKDKYRKAFNTQKRYTNNLRQGVKKLRAAFETQKRYTNNLRAGVERYKKAYERLKTQAYFSSYRLADDLPPKLLIASAQSQPKINSDSNDRKNYLQALFEKNQKEFSALSDDVLALFSQEFLNLLDDEAKDLLIKNADLWEKFFNHYTVKLMHAFFTQQSYTDNLRQGVKKLRAAFNTQKRYTNNLRAGVERYKKAYEALKGS